MAVDPAAGNALANQIAQILASAQQAADQPNGGTVEAEKMAEVKSLLDTNADALIGSIGQAGFQKLNDDVTKLNAATVGSDASFKATDADFTQAYATFITDLNHTGYTLDTTGSGSGSYNSSQVNSSAFSAGSAPGPSPTSSSASGASSSSSSGAPSSSSSPRAASSSSSSGAPSSSSSSGAASSSSSSGAPSSSKIHAPPPTFGGTQAVMQDPPTQGTWKSPTGPKPQTAATFQAGNYQISYTHQQDGANKLKITDATGKDVTPKNLANGSDGTVVLPNGAMVHVSGSQDNARIAVIAGKKATAYQFDQKGGTQQNGLNPATYLHNNLADITKNGIYPSTDSPAMVGNIATVQGATYTYLKDPTVLLV